VDTIRALAVEIGPRPACSPAEQRAAHWCAAQLGELGYEAEIEEFPSRPAYATWFVVYFAMAFVAALLIVPLPAVAFPLSLAALVAYARDSEGDPLIRPRSGRSRNVIARPVGSVRPEAVVIAHMDSARSSPSFHPSVVGSFHSSVVALNLALASVCVLSAAAWIAEAGRELSPAMWIPAGAIAVYLAVVMGLLLYGHLRMPLVAGANDNASGVAVLMRLARMDWGGRVWFVVTGSEETGMIGSRAFIDQHRDSLDGARLLNIDNVGAGRLIAVSAEGVLRERRADRKMLQAAIEAGVDDEPFKGLPTDATVLLRERMPAMTLLAVNAEGVPPNWHWPTDVIENIDPTALDRATAVARSVLEKMVLERTL
jgi:hypothetical protein